MERKNFVEWIEKKAILLEAKKVCSHCRAEFSIPDWLDTPVKCPKCQAPIEDTTKKQLLGADNPRFWQGHDGERDFFGKL